MRRAELVVIATVTMVLIYAFMIAYLALTSVPGERPWMQIGIGWLAVGVAVFTPSFDCRIWADRAAGTPKLTSTPLSPRAQQFLWLIGLLGILAGTDFLRWFPPGPGSSSLLVLILVTYIHRGGLKSLWRR